MFSCSHVECERSIHLYRAVYKDEGGLLLKLKYITSKTIPIEKSIALVKNNDLIIYIDILSLRSDVLKIFTTRLIQCHLMRIITTLRQCYFTTFM